MNEQMVLLSRRLEGLERTNRRMKGALVAMMCMLVATVAMAAVSSKPSSLKANSFQLVDSSGHPIAVLAEGPKGAALSFLDATGSPILQLGVAPSGCESEHGWYPVGCAPGLFAFTLNRAQRVSLYAGVGRPRASN